MNTRLYPLRDNPAGLAFTMDTHRFSVACAGRRSGKTERAKRKGIKRALYGHMMNHSGKARYAWCAPTHAQAKAIFWQDLKDMTEGIRADVSETERVVTLINGHEIHVAGLDQPQRLEGSPWDGFLIDEIDDVKQGFWDEHLRPCLSDRRGWSILFGVPNGMAFLYSLSQYPTRFDDWAFFSWPSREVLPADEIASALATMDARTFRQEYEASFETSSGRVYYAFDRDGIREPTLDILASQDIRVGMDFNVEPMAAVIFVERGSETWVIDEIVIERNSNTHEMVAEIRHRYDSRARLAYPDPAGNQRKTSAPVGSSDHEILRKAGFEVFARASTISVRDGINAVNSRFCSADGQRRMFVSPKCRKLIEALNRHCYKPGTSQPDQDNFVHILDAMRYPIEYLHPVRERPGWGRG